MVAIKTILFPVSIVILAKS